MQHKIKWVKYLLATGLLAFDWLNPVFQCTASRLRKTSVLQIINSQS